MAKENMNNKKKNIIPVVNISIMAAALICGAVFLAFAERPTVSETEKRKLAEFPEFSFASLIDGSYTNGIRTWYDDTVPNRDGFKDLGASLLELTGVRGEDDVKFYGDVISKEDESETVTEKQTDFGDNVDTDEISTDTDEAVTGAESEENSESIGKEDLPDGEEDGMISNNILVYKKRAIMLYGGSLSNAERYSRFVNNYKSDLGDAVNVYSMTIPTAVAYYLPEKYTDYTRDQKSDIEYMASFYEGVEYVDVYGTLSKHTEEDIYLRTDHHWQPLGAYYAAQNFCESLKLPFADISTYEKVSVDGYVGSMYGYTGDAVLLNNPETFVYYKPSNDYTCYYYNLDGTNPQKGKLFYKTSVNGSYCAFIGTDKTVLQIKTDNHNGRKLMIVKDSYGNALVPFLTGSFEEVWVIDMRYFETNLVKYIKDNGITDLLFASCMFSACGGNAKYLEYIRTLPYEAETEVFAETEAETEALTEADSDTIA